MKLWIVGKYTGISNEDKITWEFQGIFETEEKAVMSCKNENYFVMGEFELNVLLPDETEEADISYYPKLEDRNNIPLKND